MSQKPQFERGKFYSFRAITKIHIGKYAIDIADSDEFSFDGNTVRYGGVEYDVPQLRGLFGTWFVSLSDQVTQYRSQPAGVQVRPATPEGENRGASFSMGQASEEDAVVGTMSEAKQVRTAAQTGDTHRLHELRETRRVQAAQRQGVADYIQESNPNAPPPQNARDVVSELEDVFMEATDQHFQKARPVHGEGGGQNVSASESEMRAVAEADRRNKAAIAKVASELERSDPHRSRDQMGGTRHDAPDQGTKRAGTGGKYQILRDEQDDGIPVGNYNFSGGATVGNAEDARNAAHARPTDVMRVSSMQPIQVGNAVASTPQSRIAANRHAGAQVVDDPMTLHAPQAARARNTTQVVRRGNNVGIDEVGPGGGTGDVDFAHSADDLSDLIPGAIVAGRVIPPPPPPLSENEEIAEIIAGWSLKRNWQKRVEEAVEFYAEWPEALEAIFGIESSAVVKQIQVRIAAKLAEG